MTHTHIEAIQRIARLQQGSTKYIQVYPSMITETIKFVPRDNWVCTISSGYLRIWLSLKAVLMWFSKNLENPWALMTISTWSIHYLVASSICFLLLFHPASIKRLLSRLRFIFARSSGNQSDMVFLHTCNGHIPILVGWSVLVCWSPRNNCRKPVTSGNSTKKNCKFHQAYSTFANTFGWFCVSHRRLDFERWYEGLLLVIWFLMNQPIVVGGFKHLLLSISYLGCHPSHWRTPSFFKVVKTC